MLRTGDASSLFSPDAGIIEIKWFAQGMTPRYNTQRKEKGHLYLDVLSRRAKSFCGSPLSPQQISSHSSLAKIELYVRS